MSEKESSSSWIGGLIGIIVMLVLMDSELFPRIWNYINREYMHHDMLTKVQHNGSWSVGEYQVRMSTNIKVEEEPELNCGSEGSEKLFMVRFRGGIPYDAKKSPGTLIHWRCRKNDSADIVFSCSVLPSLYYPPRTEFAPQGELTPEEMEILRRRNECEKRFSDKNVLEVDGQTIVRVCQLNPDRQP